MPIIGSLGAAASRGFGQFLQRITTAITNDPFFKYVTLLLTGNPPVSTFITDASTNNLQLTISGDTKPSGYSPNKNGYYSNYFDGSGDYLNLPNATALPGSGNFTIEFWLNVPTAPTGGAYMTPFAYGSSGSVLRCFVLDSSGTYLGIWIGAGNLFLYPTTAMVGNWAHIAISRASNVVSLYVNGVSVSSVSNSTNLNEGQLYIASQAGSFLLTGYMSNFRLVAGTAVYTTNFTPPTAPLTAISGTSLLTCQSNRFIDNSTNNFAITASGNTSVNSFQPFTPNPSYATYGSTYFDGSGDYLTLSNSISASGDFTLECWFNLSSPQANYRMLCGQSVAGSGTYASFNSYGFEAQFSNVAASVVNFAYTFQVGVWYHLAMTRVGSTIYIFVNGVSQALTYGSQSTTFTMQYLGVGYSTVYPFNGYISNFRFVNGTALYTANFTPPTTQLTAVSGTSLLTCQTNQPINNNVFLDSSSNNFSITRAGNTTQGSLNPYGGNWSVRTDNDNYITVPANASLRLTGDFTIEAWVYPTTLNSQNNIFGSENNTASDFLGIGNNGVYVAINYAAFPVWSFSFVRNTWYHVALTRSSNTLRAFVNGTQLTLSSGSATNSATMFQATPLSIGRYGYTSGPLPFYGNISNARIVKGTALYTASFTPPTAPLSAIDGTSLLTCQSSRFVDNSINNLTVTKTGTVTSIQRSSPFAPLLSTPTSYSNYFDGGGNYLLLNAPTNQLNTEDYTIEFWVYGNSWSTLPVILEYGRIVAGPTPGLEFYVSTAGGKLDIYGGSATATLLASYSSLSTTAWTHIALTRASTATRLFINGTQSGASTTDSTSYTQTQVLVGIYFGGTNTLNGFISNLRVVKGTAVYTSNFTPPTAPLTAISGTSLLTCQSPTIIDNSVNNLSITVTGPVSPRSINPFGITNITDSPYTPATYSGSGYFDGSGDWLTFTGSPATTLSGDYTFECWINPSNLNALQPMMCIGDDFNLGLAFFINTSGKIYIYGNGAIVYTSTGASVQSNNWTHIAVVRSGTTLTGYINGVAQSTTTNSATYSGTFTQIGREVYNTGTGVQFVGFISNLRLVKGTAVYKSNFVPSVTPLTAIQNTSLLLPFSNGAVYDSTMLNNAETVGSTKTSTAVTKFDGGSIQFSGQGNHLVIPYNANLAFFTGDFTVELWANWSSVSDSGFVGSVSTIGMDFAYVSGSLRIGRINTAWDSTFSSWTPTANTWYHIAFTRSNGTARAFVNGVQIGTDASNGTSYSPVGGMYIGLSNGSDRPFNGYIEDLRLTKGYARYTQNFTVPTAPFPVQ